jgi:hypothetical protein
MRGLDRLSNGSLLVAGGGGTLAVIPLKVGAPENMKGIKK